jgi:hypothetical protein
MGESACGEDSGRDRDERTIEADPWLGMTTGVHLLTTSADISVTITFPPYDQRVDFQISGNVKEVGRCRLDIDLGLHGQLDVKIDAGSVDALESHPLQPDDGKIVMKFVLRNRGATPKRVVSFRAGPPTAPFAGLRGDCASRYLNSLVQSLYHTPIFWNAMLALGPVDRPDEENIILNLQMLFWKLRHEKGLQSARDLTISLGWSQDDGPAHQDGREFLRLLLDNLDGSVRSDIASIFDGKIRSTIVGEAAGHSQTSPEDFPLVADSCHSNRDDTVENGGGELKLSSSNSVRSWHSAARSAAG